MLYQKHRKGGVSMRKILVCTDGSNHSKEAAIKASNFIQKLENVKVYVLHVQKDPSNEMKRNVGMPRSENIDHMNQEGKAQGDRVLDETAKIFEEKRIPVTKELKTGNPTNKIINFANQEGIDLIVLGHRGRNGIQKLLLGSVSNSVAQKTTKDVWIIK